MKKEMANLAAGQIMAVLSLTEMKRTRHVDVTI